MKNMNMHQKESSSSYTTAELYFCRHGNLGKLSFVFSQKMKNYYCIYSKNNCILFFKFYYILYRLEEQ